MLRGLLFMVIMSLVTMEECYGKQTHHRNHHRGNEVQVLDIEERLALEHSQRVAEAGACDEPKLQVIHVSDHYPGRYFLPHCTLLHRCGKHAGCCGTDRLRCVAKTKEKVTLHFYSVRIGDQGAPIERQIEKLSFYNHTKCACAPTHQVSKHDL